MAIVRSVLFCCALLVYCGAAFAGPCNTTKDAGSGPTPGHTGQMKNDSAKPEEHPPTSTMNRAAAGSATSPQDVQRQTKGEPTAAQQAEGAKNSKPEDGC